MITTYRPDPVVDPEFENFPGNVERFGEIAGEDVSSYSGYLAAHRKPSGSFSSRWVRPPPITGTRRRPRPISIKSACEALYRKALKGAARAEEAELFRAQMLTEMAKDEPR